MARALWDPVAEAAAVQRAPVTRVSDGSARRLAAVFDELPLPLWQWELEVMGLEGRPRTDLDPDPGDGNPSYGYEILSPIQFDVVRHAEQIYTPETYYGLRFRDRRDYVAWKPVRFVNILAMMVGKGGGKDRVAALTQLRLVYLLLCLKSPQRYFGIGSSSKIDMLNTASSEGQAQTIFYEEMKGLLGAAPWYRGQYSITANEIWYDRHGKRIHSISGNSKQESQEGMNLLYGCLDEIDAFSTKEEREATARTQRGAMLNAEAITEMMLTSGASRFPRAFKVLMLSWPRYRGSTIWNAHHLALKDFQERGEESRLYAIPNEHGAATWESNPIRTREDFDADFRDNPELAWAKYACRPPASSDPYFKNNLALDVNFRTQFPLNEFGEPIPPLVIEYYWGLPGDDDFVEGALNYVNAPNLKPSEGWQVRFHWAEWFYGDAEFLRAAHVDIGIKRDRCGIAMSHVRGFADQEITAIDEETHQPVRQLVRRPLVTVDLVTHLEAPKPDGVHPGGEVEIRWVRKMLFELMNRGFPLHRVTFDGFQSTDSIQQLKGYGIESEVLSLDRNMTAYDTAKSVLYAGGMIAAPNELLRSELQALTIVMGKKVDHPPGGSKDLADAWAGSVVGAIEVSEFMGSMNEVIVGPSDDHVDEDGWGWHLRGAEKGGTEDPFDDAAAMLGLPTGMSGMSGTPLGM